VWRACVWHEAHHVGGVLGRNHLLKDTASGARQHPLRTYQGTASTAEGDSSAQLLTHLKVPHLLLVVAEGDRYLMSALVQQGEWRSAQVRNGRW